LPHRFAKLEQSAGNRPFPQQRSLAALDRDNAAACDDQRAHSDQRLLRILSLGQIASVSRLNPATVTPTPYTLVTTIVCRCQRSGALLETDLPVVTNSRFAARDGSIIRASNSWVLDPVEALDEQLSLSAKPVTSH
jgi:hypothetical protein